MNREQLSHNQDGMFVEHGEERREGEKDRRRGEMRGEMSRGKRI